VTDEAKMEEMAKLLLIRFGRIDYRLINSAGSNISGSDRWKLARRFDQ